MIPVVFPKVPQSSLGIPKTYQGPFPPDTQKWRFHPALGRTGSTRARPSGLAAPREETPRDGSHGDEFGIFIDP